MLIFNIKTCAPLRRIVTSAFNGDGQPVAHSEHAQVDPLVFVQLLIESVQTLGGEVSGIRVHHSAAPQHLQIQSRQSTFPFCSQ